ncbi:MAG: hypothetical protein M3Y59_14620 [Myxococcota bacterium]|nr:hypothetical protein [Myxococcota bacterium]
MERTPLDEGFAGLDREDPGSAEILQETYVVQELIDVEGLDVESLEVDFRPSAAFRWLLLGGLGLGGGLLAYALLNGSTGPHRRLTLRNRFEWATAPLRSRRSGLHVLSPRTRPDMVVEDRS